MATTGVDFVLQNKVTTFLSGAAVTTAPALIALDPTNAKVLAGRVPGGTGTGVLGANGVINNGNFLIDGFAEQGFAKNGAYHKSTTGTNAATVDLTNFAGGASTTATSTAGDLVFAKANRVRIQNCGTADMTVIPGASNGNVIVGAANSSTVLSAGSFIIWNNAAGQTVDATHKNITVTPTAGGDFVVAVGGS